MANHSDSGGPAVVSVPRVWLWFSSLVAVLVTLTSLLGILVPATYSREAGAWAIQAVGQDWANLAVVVLLLASTWHVYRRSARAFLVWLGAHLYLVYAFAIYAFAVHFQFLFLVYVAVLGLSFYSLVVGARSFDPDRLAGKMPGGGRARAAGVLLLVIGALFGLLWLGEIVPALLGGTVPAALAETGLWVNPVHVLDLAILLPAMVLAGVSLLRDRSAGKVLAVPLLVFALTMGLGIVVMFGLSAARGLDWPKPAAALIAVIMGLSAWFAVRWLRGMRSG
ncbi:hypothetical protein JXB37_08030 [candidate division WOR-3 bacterium]|nr:hypothetical protein [candidate division WOR-3 bacterium]